MSHELIRKILKDEFYLRKSRNVVYSLRALARDLKSSPAAVSQVLKGKRSVSHAFAQKVLKIAAIPEGDSLDILSQLKKTNQSRGQVPNDSQFHSLEDDQFQLISDWYHYGILELSHLDSHKIDPNWVAKRLGVTRAVASSAIDRLMRMKLLKEENGRFIQMTQPLSTPTGHTSLAIRKFHTQILTKALKTLESSNVEERNFSAVTLSVATEDIPRAKELIKNFRREFKQLIEQGSKDRVYCLSLQLFPLDNI